MWSKVDDIIQEVKPFYEKLYKMREPEGCEILNKMVEDMLTFDTARENSLEVEISLQGANFALTKKYKNNNSPSSDGFTVEFFKVFWLQLGAFVVRSLNEGFRRCKLSSPQKEGVNKKTKTKMETNFSS